METTNTKGIQYIMHKRKHENEQSFQEKCWNITKQCPQTQQEFNNAAKISQLRQNEKDFGCVYSKDVKSHIHTQIT